MSRVTFGFAFWIALLGSIIGHTGVVAAQSNTVTEVEIIGGSTLNLDGSRALVSTSNGRSLVTADSGEHKVLPMIGLAVNVWRSQNFGSFFDLSYVDGGTASAGVGSNTSTVSSNMFDFHGGLQLQASSGRVRPYGLVGGGFARATTTGTLTLFGVTSNLDSSEWLSSIIYGAGVRVMFSERIGVRAGFEGVTATPISSDAGGSKTYGRLLVGAVLSSKS
jgi:opacity protein-like surface antigen